MRSAANISSSYYQSAALPHSGNNSPSTRHYFSWAPNVSPEHIHKHVSRPSSICSGIQAANTC
ncbi:hypothetical protein GCK32_017768 [Trichostrongylus colubriformis]|uniref:Uncharacterized protein n=1 Tax=Trichostrongylus colubriformis TaxID=6319 RepID=A0AAN8F400_TRICO